VEIVPSDLNAIPLLVRAASLAGCSGGGAKENSTIYGSLKSNTEVCISGKTLNEYGGR